MNKTDNIEFAIAVAATESLIAIRLSRGPAGWGDLEKATTNGYNPGQFETAMTRMLDSGQMRAVGCESMHGCRFEAGR